jgi:hypothetical protein
MIEVKIDLREIEGFAEALRAQPELAEREIRSTMTVAMDTLEQAVAGYTPVNTGVLRGSLAVEIHGHPLYILTGELGTPLIYGEVVEYGRRPGSMPPVDAIEMWVIRKLGISPGEESRAAAFAIARAIKYRGTKGQKYFEQGYAAASPAINRYIDNLPERILRGLA